MKKITRKLRYMFLMLSISLMSMMTFAFAEDDVANLDEVVNPVVKLINSLLTPLLAVVGAGGALFCVFLGVKFARAEDPQEHEKVKKALKNAIIGFVLIFVLLLALKMAMPRLTTWVEDYQAISPTPTPAK